MSEVQRYKIAVVAPFPPLQGGMVQLAVELANNLEKDGHRVLRINLGAGKAGIVWLPMLYLRFLWMAFRSDIVHIVSASGPALWAKDLPAILCARLFGKKAILNFVGGAAAERVPAWGWRKRFPFRLAHKVVVPTELFRDSLIQAGLEARFEVIPHVVDIEPFLAVESVTKAPILVGAKGLEPYAGFDQLIDIFCQVREQIRDAELWIAGEGSARSDLDSLVERKKIQGVRFLGAVPHVEMPALMAQGAVFVHGTRYESFGIALVEAMAAGLPVVAFSIGGIPEVVMDGETGFLIPYGDTGIFSEKVIALLENQSRREQMRHNARAFSRRFGWQKIGQRWYELYHALATAQ